MNSARDSLSMECVVRRNAIVQLNKVFGIFSCWRLIYVLIVLVEKVFIRSYTLVREYRVISNNSFI